MIITDKDNVNTTNTIDSNNITGQKYIVTRNSIRVSDMEYSSKDDALSEYNMWSRIIAKHPDGSKVEIVNVSVGVV